jgi:hypothetical protein
MLKNKRQRGEEKRQTVKLFILAAIFRLDR